MKYDFTDLKILANGKDEEKAAELFSKEIQRRTGKIPALCDGEPKIVFETDNTFKTKDEYLVTLSEKTLTIRAKSLRGLIYGYSLFLRKSLFENGKITLIKDISGKYAPQKEIRGHQLGYRTTPNTYDAWDYDRYFRYYLDMMAFGANTVEHNGTKPERSRNKLMKYEQYDFLKKATELADDIDLDVSLWQANSDDETEEEALSFREKLYSEIPRLDYLFIPGGDPGSLPADVFFDRCKKIGKVLKKSHPDAKLQPSAQAPHQYRNWGEVFVDEMNGSPEDINAFIVGPNHAFPPHELRKKVSEKYPMRFYPDITHNLRCEYPVNFLHDDWHYTYSSCLSRESVNPRPTELRTLQRVFSQYTIGGVSYSEGVHDDVNKAVWSALEFDSNTPLREILLDYTRFFMYGADCEKIVDCIFALEKSWSSAPEESADIDFAYDNLLSLKEKYPFLSGNWRFMLLYFRACCDKVVKLRRVFELSLIKDSEIYLRNGDISKAEEILNSHFPKEYEDLRKELDVLGERLFNLIGIQLDVEHYCADGWERGAVLDTIDNNVTDRNFLIKKCGFARTLPESERKEYLNNLLDCRKSKPGEVYYSVALNGLDTLGVRQDGEFYMDFQGDRPYTKENPLPMGMVKVYDHFSFRANFGGFKENTDYILKITFKNGENDSEKFKITANGNTVYEGKAVGGKRDGDFDKKYLADGFFSAEYLLPKEFFINGVLELSITESEKGFKFCEIRIFPKTF